MSSAVRAGTQDLGPLISVMIPTHEPGEYLSEALRSVLAQGLSEELMQIAIVDDCSRRSKPSDLIAALPAARRIEVHTHEENAGLARNWNRAIALARGELVHILHQDDLVLPGFYERLTGAMRRSPHVGMAFCRHSYIDATGRVERISHRERWRAGILRKWLERITEKQRVQCPAVIVRRSVYEQLGGFNSELRYALDWEMWVRIAARYPVWYEPKVLACYRRHASAESARLRTAGLVDAELLRTIEMIAPILPQPVRGRLTQRAYRTLYEMQMRRAAKLLRAFAGSAALEQLASADTTFIKLPRDHRSWWSERRMSRMRAQLATQHARKNN